jgi:hypothetical protein
MKQIIKDYLYLELGIIVLAIIIVGGIFPIMYIANGAFVILYIVILYPLIMLGIYKIIITLYTKK